MTHCVLYAFSTMGSSRLLEDDEIVLFRPVCQNLNLPLQPPISVSFHKKVTIREKPTGWIIEYKPSNIKGYTVVSLKQSADLAFGQVESFLTYRNNVFTIIQKFESLTHISSGLVCISDPSVCKKELFPLEAISRPLVTALNERSELWILNA